MMSGNPSWWSMIMNGDNNMHPPQISPPSHHDQFAYNPLSISHDNTTSSLPNSNPSHQADQDFPLRSWSQLLLGGLGGGEEEQELRFDHANLFQQQKKFGNWEEQQVLNLNNTPSFSTKQEAHVQSSNYGYVNDILNFSAASKTAAQRKRNHSTECQSSGIVGGVSKKARVQHDHELSSQPVLKVRKEKVMARITALHQLVSPFGKTDQASVLSEAISCIRFLQAQIEAYSSPYMQNASGNTVHHQHADSQGLEFEDLRSRGLCLVPVSNCTQHLENDNGADYWGPGALGGGF